jgi:hypothetical protein
MTPDVCINLNNASLYKVFGCGTFYFLEYVLCLWAENNDLWILKHLHAFNLFSNEKVVSGMPSVCMYVCTYVCMHVYECM